MLEPSFSVPGREAVQGERVGPAPGSGAAHDPSVLGGLPPKRRRANFQCLSSERAPVAISSFILFVAIYPQHELDRSSGRRYRHPAAEPARAGGRGPGRLP